MAAGPPARPAEPRAGPPTSARRASSTGTNRGSTGPIRRGSVRGMKPLVIFALWALLGWNVGSWVDTVAGVPALLGIVGGVAAGAALAIASQRQVAAAAARAPRALGTTPVEPSAALDRAA